MQGRPHWPSLVHIESSLCTFLFVCLCRPVPMELWPRILMSSLFNFFFVACRAQPAPRSYEHYNFVCSFVWIWRNESMWVRVWCGWHIITELGFFPSALLCARAFGVQWYDRTEYIYTHLPYICYAMLNITTQSLGSSYFRRFSTIILIHIMVSFCHEVYPIVCNAFRAILIK